MTAGASSPDATLLLLEGDRGVLVVEGPDRVTWLNGVITCDVVRVTPEHGALGLLLNKQGKIQTELRVVASSSALFLSVSPGTAAGVAVDLERMLVMEDAEVSERGPELAVVTLYGGGAALLARALPDPAKVAWGGIQRGGVATAELIVERGGLERACAALEAAGAQRATRESWLAFRVAHGLGAFGQDFGPDDNPHEAGLERQAVDWSKGCYLGQEVVFMQDARGRVKRRLVALQITGGLPAAGTPVQAPSGDAAGEMTSAVAVPGGALALGRIRAPHFEPGTKLVAAGFPAEVRKTPL